MTVGRRYGEHCENLFSIKQLLYTRIFQIREEYEKTEGGGG